MCLLLIKYLSFSIIQIKGTCEDFQIIFHFCCFFLVLLYEKCSAHGLCLVLRGFLSSADFAACLSDKNLPNSGHWCHIQAVWDIFLCPFMCQVIANVFFINSVTFFI